MNKLSTTRLILTILIVIVHSSCFFGQSLTGPYWMYDNHYLSDKYLINPAFAGFQYYPKIFIGTQRLEMLQDAPSVHLAGFHGRVGIKRNHSSRYLSNENGARNALGGLVFADNNGPYQTVGLKFDYVFSIFFRSTKSGISFGLGGIVFSNSLRLEKYADYNDPFILENTGKNFITPDFNSGILFFHNKLYVGFSASQLMENSYKFANNGFTNSKPYRNYYLLTGYRFVFNWLEIEPSFVIGQNFAPDSYNNQGKFFDVNLELFLKPVVFIQSFRIDGYSSCSLLYRTQRLELGIRADLFSTDGTDAQFTGIAAILSYTFLPSNQ